MTTATPPMTLRVGMNAYFLAHPRTGSGQYVLHLLEAAPAQAIEYVLWSFHPATSQQYPICRVPAVVRNENLAKLWFEQVTLPRVAAGSGVQLLHYPYWASPLRRSHVPVVVTIHDVIPALLPDYRGSRMVRAYTALVARAARSAGKIITDSACSKRDIMRLLAVPDERIHVVYLAAEERYRPLQQDQYAYAAELRARLGISDRYIMYIGGLDVRKNIPVLVRAYAEALRRIRNDGDAAPCQLVIVGDLARTGSTFFPDPRQVVRECGLIEGQDVVFPGPVPADTEKIALLGAATGFAFPSLYEGFGLPPLEAMACGTPVVCSTGGSLPEIVGDAALVHAPDDIQGLAAALVRIVRDDTLRADLRQRGLAQAARFSWSRCAAETRTVYEYAALKKK